jgi:RNA polymerase sigma-70 factor (sigma-E family)
VRPGFRRAVRKNDAAASDPPAASNRPIHMNRPLADTALVPIPVQWDADRALTTMYGDHYRCLVGLALLLVQDLTTAEGVVQDSFVAMHTAWRRRRDSDEALAYLHRSVVNRSRSAPQHGSVIEPNASPPGPGIPGAEPGALTSPQRATVVGALRSLPARQREALALRYYGDLPEAQVAAAMGVSQGAVRRHLARATAALETTVEADP